MVLNHNRFYNTNDILVMLFRGGGLQLDISIFIYKAFFLQFKAESPKTNNLHHKFLEK